RAANPCPVGRSEVRGQVTNHTCVYYLADSRFARVPFISASRLDERSDIRVHLVLALHVASLMRATRRRNAIKHREAARCAAFSISRKAVMARKSKPKIAGTFDLKSAAPPHPAHAASRSDTRAPDSPDDFLSLAIKRADAAYQAAKDNIDAAYEDLQFLAGDQWPDYAK